LDLVQHHADFQIRETFESALALAAAALEMLGSSAGEVSRIASDIRHRDLERFQLELSGGISAGGALFSHDASGRKPA
jgi:voltage-gated potassium channel Kch